MKILIAMLALAMALETGVVLQPPLGLDLYMPVPEANPLTRAKVELGRQLFFDKRLSRDQTLSCASCHDPRLAFSDGRAAARGINGAEGPRNSPALINRGYGTAFFWDGRAVSLERQAIEPILNPKELGMTEPELELRLGRKSAEVTGALASFVRTIRSGDSRFDRYAAGKKNALNALEKHDGSLATLDDVIEFYSRGGRLNPNLDTEIRAANFTDGEKRALLAFLQSLTGRIQQGWKN